jgi:invasion protein IalB
MKPRHEQARLAVARHRPYLTAMRLLIALMFLVCLATPLAWSQTKPTVPSAGSDSPVPKLLGKFGDWRTASHVEAGQNVCYAYTQVSSSTPAMPGRGQVTLTVTQRPQGPRDAVAVSPGFAYAANATVAASVDGNAVDFYTAQRSAFARDGRATVQAFLKGRQVMVKSPHPKGSQVTDSFSLKGFAAAYAATNKACPQK